MAGTLQVFDAAAQWVLMTNSNTKTPLRKIHHGARFVAFILLSTIGMSTLAIALLAPPIVGYYRDQQTLNNAKTKIAKLKEIQTLNAELLENVENPTVVARAAINHLNYVPADNASRIKMTAPAQWPQLEQALSRLQQPQNTNAPPKYLALAKSLAQQPKKLSILMVLGSVLVVVSMTFFNRRR